MTEDVAKAFAAAKHIADFLRERGGYPFTVSALDHFIKHIGMAHYRWPATECLPKWQDISTAPKDGTLVLVWPYWGDGKPSVVYWRDLKRGPGRWEINSSFYCYGAQPTHWMPLPAPPAPSPQANAEVGS